MEPLRARDGSFFPRGIAMNPLDERLGCVIRSARRQHGLTQRALAQRCGISLRHLASIESGANFSVAALASIVGELPEVAAAIGECLAPPATSAVRA
jgi:ribosome-binding protein aMBF1 (putative translation factor)